MGERFVDRLTAIMVDGDLDAADDLLRSLEGPDLAEAKAWFAANKRWFDGVSELVGPGGYDGYEQRWARFQQAQWMTALCAVSLCGPATAARRVPWRWLRSYSEEPGEAAFIHLLWDADRAWVEQFSTTASEVRVSGGDVHVLAEVLRAVIVHHGLPCPRGQTFLQCWWAGTPARDSLAERLAADPLMPELLPRYLASGHCGDLPELPQAVAELEPTGLVDRDAILELVLELLTTNQRPKSQKVLAQTAAALRVQPHEVPGGLTYLLGVLSTAYREVVPVLLPLAISLVTTTDELLELTTVVAGRPEKSSRTTLLAALKKPDLVASVGPAGVLEACAVLADSEDAAFATSVRRYAAALEPSTADDGRATRAEDAGHTRPEDAAPSLGLWDVRPPAGIPRPGNAWPNRDPRWDEVLSSRFRHRATAQPLLVGLTLAAMADGTFGDGEAMRSAAGRLLLDQHLALSALASVADDLFLAGGLRQGWPVVLGITDAACAAALRPAGLAGLLRSLTRYAAEVPRPWPVPTHVAALAAAAGSSKAQAEARRLVDALGQGEVHVAAPLAEGASAAATPVTAPEHRGLWDRAAPGLTALPSTRRLPDDAGRRQISLDDLRLRLSQDYNGYAQSHEDVSHWPPGYSVPSSSTSLTNPDLVLASVVAAVDAHGEGAVRRALAGISRTYNPLDVVAAVDAWAAGALDVSTFWRVAHAPTLTLSALWRRWQAEGLSYDDLQARRGAFPAFGERLRAPDDPELNALVLPDELASGPERLAFLRASEALVRAERHPMVLSTPTWADGTLELDDLLHRLAVVAAGPDPSVGPIDLVQALHRLRPADPGRAADVPQGILTDARFTSPAGHESWDATAMVREWVAAGGLPPLHPTVDQAGRWCTGAVAPVPLARLAALPSTLADDPWTPGPMVPTLRLMPRWADRVCEEAHAELVNVDPRFFPGHAAGPMGVPLHDRLLAMVVVPNHEHFHGVPVLAEFAQQGRLDPEMIAAAAVGRHDRGTLRLGVLVRSLQRALDVTGAFAGLWPSALSIAAALSVHPRRPSALPDLLRLLTTYAHEVPASAAQLPVELRTLAGRGSTKSHQEARALVAALDWDGGLVS